MKKYAKIIDEKCKKCEVGLGTNEMFYQSIGMTQMDVEQANDGTWYVAGYVRHKEPRNYIEKRQMAYPSISDQLDAIYWDKINGTNLWVDTITQIKTKYPKDIT